MSHWSNEEVGKLIKTLDDLVDAINLNTHIYDIGKYRDEHLMVKQQFIACELDRATQILKPFKKHNWWKKDDNAEERNTEDSSK